MGLFNLWMPVFVQVHIVDSLAGDLDWKINHKLHFVTGMNICILVDVKLWNLWLIDRTIVHERTYFSKLIIWKQNSEDVFERRLLSCILGFRMTFLLFLLHLGFKILYLLILFWYYFRELLVKVLLVFIYHYLFADCPIMRNSWAYGH